MSNLLPIYRMILTIACFLACFGIAGSFAQEPPCANEVIEPFLLRDPQYKQEFEAINQAIAAGAAQKTGAGTILEIPLAVHILHNGEPVGTGTNISDQQILDAVRGANERWRLLQGNGVDMEVQFCLAQTDPQGRPSTGITRIDASGIQYYTQYGIAYSGSPTDTGANELTIKNLSNWNHNLVYNIWVVNKIAGGWGGYALFPLVNNFPTDGTVIIASTMRYTSSTLAHELGHGMGLFHTFNGDFNGCPGNSVCALLGDQVCDTPPHRQADCASTPCSNATDSLLQLSFKNYMSYCGGRNLFTQGQKDRSRSIIQTTSRRLLLRSTVCYPTCDTSFTTLLLASCDPLAAGTRKDTLANAAGCDSIVTTVTTLLPGPDAGFSFSSGSGTVIEFENQSEHADTYSWDLGDGNSSTDSDPEHTYAGGGSYDVVLIATNGCGSDTARATVSIVSTGLGAGRNAYSLLLFPNPNSGRFSLQSSSAFNGDEAAELINALGQTVQVLEIGSGRRQELQLQTGLAAGLYRLVIRNGAEILGNIPVLLNREP